MQLLFATQPGRALRDPREQVEVCGCANADTVSALLQSLREREVVFVVFRERLALGNPGLGASELELGEVGLPPPELPVHINAGTGLGAHVLVGENLEDITDVVHELVHVSVHILADRFYVIHDVASS